MEKQYDVCIVGGGPAGLTAALYAARSGVRVLVAEKAGICGGTTTSLPRIENYPAVPNASGYDLTERMTAQAREAGADIIFDTVSRLEHGARKVLTLYGGETVSCAAVVLAMGCVPRKLGLADEKSYLGAGLSYCAVCDGNFYRGKTVAVVGDGAKATEAVAYLTPLCARVYRIVAGDTEGEDVIRGAVVALEGKPIQAVRVRTDEQEMRLPIDGIFVELGDTPAAAFVSDLLRDDAGYLVTDAHMQTSAEGIFAAGDVRSTPLRQIITAASDGAIAGQFAAIYAKKANRE